MGATPGIEQLRVIAIIAIEEPVVHSGRMCRRVMLCVALSQNISGTYLAVLKDGVKSVNFSPGVVP